MSRPLRHTSAVYDRVPLPRWDLPLIGMAARILRATRGNGLPDDADVLGAAVRAGALALAGMPTSERTATLDGLVEAREETTVLVVIALHPLDEARVRMICADISRPFRSVLQGATRRGLALLIESE